MNCIKAVMEIITSVGDMPFWSRIIMVKQQRKYL